MAMSSWGSAVRFGLPGLVLGLALSSATGGGKGLQAQGANPAPAGERTRAMAAGDGSGTIAFTTPLAGGAPGAQLLYLIDTKLRAFSVYRVDPAGNAKGTVKLEAARNYQWDLKLSDYNNAGLVPTDIETAVRAGGPMKR